MTKRFGKRVPLALDEIVDRDLTALARAGAPPVAHRVDPIVLELESLLVQGGKHPMLAGEPGVGRTAIVQELARRIMSGRESAFALALALALIAGCGEGSAPVVDAGTDAHSARLHAELAWRLRCDAAGGGCSYVDHVVDAYDGDGGLDLTCNVVESATSRRVALGAASGSLYTFAISNVEIPRGSVSPSGLSGLAAVLEGGDAYLGDCGGDAPTLTQACQVTIGFTTDAEGTLIVGEISCVGLRQYMSPTPVRELTGPGEGPPATMAPATFRFHDCRGYVPD